MDGPDRRITHAVASGLQVTGEAVPKPRIRTGRNRQVIPTVGSAHRPEFTALSIWFQLQIGRLMSVMFGDFHFARNSRVIVNSQDNTVTLNIVDQAAGDVCTAICDASLEDAEETIGTENRQIVFGLAV